MKVLQCRLCGDGKLSKPKIKFPPTPLANEFLNTQDRQDTFPLEVCVCEKCQHYQLNESIDPERLFRHYVYVAGTSPVNVEHFRQYAIHMVEKFGLKLGDRVLDIASNDGVLLQHFKDLNMSILGIDPARNLAEQATRNGILTIPEFFTERFAEYMLGQHEKFHLITANNVFAHVPDLADFAKGVKKILRHDGVFSFEVSYFGDVCDKILFDTIYHEHSSYHTLTPLISFFNDLGMQLFDVERITNHGGSIRVFVQHKGGPNHPSHTVKHILNQEKNIAQRVSNLQQKIKYLGLELREMLRDYKDHGKSIAIYGTPAKATTLMYGLGIKREWIEFAVDDNSLKQNTFTPGMHIPVLHSSEIPKRSPDVVLVLAWNFSDSIIKKCQKEWETYHRDYRYPIFITPLPEIEIERYCENKTCTCGMGPFTLIATSVWFDTEVSQFKCEDCGGIVNSTTRT